LLHKTEPGDKMAELLPVIKASFYDSNGEPLSGGKLYSYEAGTTTPKATYTNRAGNVANTNPVILDVDGQADVWLDDGYYKFVLEDADGNLQYTEDNIAAPQVGALESAFWRGVVYITSAESPYTITAADNGKLISVDSSGGAVSVVLPEISSLSLPFNVGVKKTTGSNNVTVNRSGTDTLDGDTSKVLTATNAAVQLLATDSTSPDRWSVINSTYSVNTAMIEDSAVTPDKLATQARPMSVPFNYSVVTSVASNAMTIALKTFAGVDASANDVIRFPFRSATAANGDSSVASVSSALSLVIPNGSAIGLTSGYTNIFYLYAILNSGVVELAISRSYFDEGSLVTTTTIPVGNGFRGDIYSATGRSNVPIFLLARYKISEPVAGAWSVVPSETSLPPFAPTFPTRNFVNLTTSSGNGSTGVRVKVFTSNDTSGTALLYTSSAVNGDSIEVREDGLYAITYGGSAGAQDNFGISKNGSTTTPFSSLAVSSKLAGSSIAVANFIACSTWTGWLYQGDVIRAHQDGSTAGSTSNNFFYMLKIG